jgi:hypothetical protein
MAKYHYSDEEILFIESNWKSSTDKEIAQILGRTEESVSRQRKKHGWMKRSGRPTKLEKDEALKNNMKSLNGPESLTALQRISLTNLDKGQRVALFKDNFSNHPRHNSLKEELSPTEMTVYIHKYVDFLESVDTMTPNEEDALHHMIMTDINISRIRRHIRRAEELNEEDGAPLVHGLYEMLEKLEKRFVDYQKILNVTREKRLSKDKEQSENIHTIVLAYKGELARQEMGRQAGLMEIFKEQCKGDMDKYRYLLGG